MNVTAEQKMKKGIRYGTEPTQDLLMILGVEKFAEPYSQLCYALGTGKTIPCLVKKLGRQDHCWVGSSENRRFYVWKIEELWVLGHNTKGVCLEVPRGTTPERAMALIQALCATIQT